MAISRRPRDVCLSSAYSFISFLSLVTDLEPEADVVCVDYRISKLCLLKKFLSL